MSSKRIVFWAAALLLSIPTAASGQPDTGGEKKEAAGISDEQPQAETAEAKEDDDDETPTGTPEPVEPKAKTERDVDAKAKVDVTVEADEAEEVVVEKVEVEKNVTITRSGAPRIGSAWNRSQAEKEGKNHLWSLDIGGRIRAGYTGIQNDPDGRFGNHDGFLVGSARLTLDGRLKSLGFKLQIEGAAADREDPPNDPNGEVVVRLRDANLYFQPVKFVRLTAGQFKPPFDVEEQQATTEILFAERSVGSRGVKNIEGRNVRGLSSGRQVGIMLGAEPFHFGSDEREGFGLSYALALTNGQNANSALNDNDKFAFYGRAEVHWADLVSLGGAYEFNDRTLGVEPNTIDERRTGWTADLTFTGWDITLIGSVMSKSIARPTLEDIDPETSGFAYQGQLAYKAPFGIQPAFRYAFFDPTEDPSSADALTYLTFGLNWVPDFPVQLQLNYTIAGETEEFSIPNNRFDGVVQVTW